MTALMLATPYADAPDPHARAARDLAAFLPLLNRLRFLAQRCRADARLDLSEACSAIHADRAKSLDSLATAMIRVIPEAIDGHVVFLAPGARGMSFDEEWLLRLIECATKRDGASVEFLLRRRVSRQNHHAFRSIIRAVSALCRD